MWDDLGDNDSLGDDLLMNLHVIHLSCLPKLDFLLNQLSSLERENYHHYQKDVKHYQQAQETPPALSHTLALRWLVSKVLLRARLLAHWCDSSATGVATDASASLVIDSMISLRSSYRQTRFFPILLAR